MDPKRPRAGGASTGIDTGIEYTYAEDELRQGVAEAQVFSAVDLTDTQKTDFAKSLARLTGKTVDPAYFVDPDLLGGALVRVGDTIYDGSLRNSLQQLRARLTAVS